MDQKDKALSTLSILLAITEETSEIGKKMRRMLLRFRSEQELKFVSDLKNELADKKSELASNNTDGNSNIPENTSQFDENQMNPVLK